MNLEDIPRLGSLMESRTWSTKRTLIWQLMINPQITKPKITAWTVWPELLVSTSNRSLLILPWETILPHHLKFSPSTMRTKLKFASKHMAVLSEMSNPRTLPQLFHSEKSNKVSSQRTHWSNRAQSLLQLFWEEIRSLVQVNYLTHLLPTLLQSSVKTNKDHHSAGTKEEHNQV